MITRFAPSPTGLLHLGHAFAAHLAQQLARENEGLFLLRFEDIDHTRVRPEYYAAIEEDLSWLGIQWDAPPWRQLDRLDSYQNALETLKSLDVIYPCFCTRREIESELSHLTNAPHGPEGPLYPGTCRNLKKIPTDKEPAWRLDAQKAATLAGPLTFHDFKHGETTVDPLLLGDVILSRKDIGTSYHLAVVCDDAAQHITHITRGEDLLPSTHVHRLLQTLLDLPEPEFHHHQLVHDDQGERLAKRHDALSLRALRKSGMSPADVFSQMPPLNL